MKVSWYDVSGWPSWLRDGVILLHAPYTLWHLAYVVIGASLASTMHWGVLVWTILAFFLAMGMGAHCLDELCGRPLQTSIPSSLLWIISLASIAGAVIIGIMVGVQETGWVIPCIIFGGFIVFAYNLELFKGFFHADIWFAAAWGAFPVITAYVAQEHSISWLAVIVSLACLFYSMAQRVLSKQVRFFRREVKSLSLAYEEAAPTTPYHSMIRTLGREKIIGAPERALRIMTWAIIIIAIGAII